MCSGGGRRRACCRGSPRQTLVRQKGIALLLIAGLVDESTLHSVNAAATADAPAAANKVQPVGAGLDRARARAEGLCKRMVVAERAVSAAKATFAEIREEHKELER